MGILDLNFSEGTQQSFTFRVSHLVNRLYNVERFYSSLTERAPFWGSLSKLYRRESSCRFSFSQNHYCNGIITLGTRFLVNTVVKIGFKSDPGFKQDFFTDVVSEFNSLVRIFQPFHLTFTYFLVNW